ncbi:MAG: hypothetical protein ACTHKL_15400 [Streptosporangiaceae bacterium]
MDKQHDGKTLPGESDVNWHAVEAALAGENVRLTLAEEREVLRIEHERTQQKPGHQG